jgi:hypothetical protein
MTTTHLELLVGERSIEMVLYVGERNAKAQSREVAHIREG